MGVVTIVFAAGLLLTGCVVAPPDPTQPPTSTPMPSPSRRPRLRRRRRPRSPPPDRSTRSSRHITVRPEHLDLVNGAGIVVGELSYDADAGTFVDTISTVLGGPPDVEEHPGGHEWHAWTSYTWPGLVVSDDHEPSGYPSDMNVGSGSRIRSWATGSPSRRCRASGPATICGRSPIGWARNGTRTGYDEFPVETRADLGERMYDSWTDTYWKYANANAVSVNQWSGNDPSVTSVISAPWNFGIGHV